MLIDVSGANVKNQEMTRIAQPYEIHHDLRVCIFLGTLYLRIESTTENAFKCPDTEWTWMSDLRRSQC